MAKPKETNELVITPIEEKNTQELIEAIKPKALSIRRQSQRILSETNLSELPQLDSQQEEFSTQTLIENIIKPFETANTEPSKTETISIPEPDTQTIIRNLRPVRACQATKKRLTQPDPKNSNNNLVQSVNAFIEEINTKTPSEKVTEEKNSNSNENKNCDNLQPPTTDLTTEKFLEIPDSKPETVKRLLEIQDSNTENVNKSLETSESNSETDENEKECPCGEKDSPVIIKKGKIETDFWTQCEKCNTWWHQHCAGVIQKSGESNLPDHFECSVCITKQIAELQKHLNNLKKNSCLNLDTQNKNKTYKVKQKKERTYAETKAPPPQEKNLIVIVDGVTKNYISSANIKQEIAKYYPEIKIEHCYQLVKGRISIHVKDKEFEKTLLNPCSPGAFGTDTKLNSLGPSSHNKKSIVVKK